MVLWGQSVVHAMLYASAFNVPSQTTSWNGVMYRQKKKYKPKMCLSHSLQHQCHGHLSGAASIAMSLTCLPQRNRRRRPARLCKSQMSKYYNVSIWQTWKSITTSLTCYIQQSVNIAAALLLPSKSPTAFSGGQS